MKLGVVVLDGRLAINEQVRSNLPRSKRPPFAHRIDYLGAVLLTTTTAASLLPLSWGGILATWSSPTITGLASVAGFGLVLLLLLPERPLRDAPAG